MGWTRRLWLGSFAAGGALALGWAVLPARQRLVADTLPTLPEGTRALNGWMALAPDGRVTLINQAQRLVWVNIGQKDGLQRQTTFSVFDSAVTMMKGVVFSLSSARTCFSRS